MKLIRVTILFALLIAGAATADDASRLRDGGPPTGIRLAGTEAASVESKVYIVQLRTPSASEFHVSSATNVIGKPAPGQIQSVPVFDRNDAAVQSHVLRLETEQTKVIRSAGPNIEPIYSYRYTINGFAARMTPAEANQSRTYAGSVAHLGRRGASAWHQLQCRIPGVVRRDGRFAWRIATGR